MYIPLAEKIRPKTLNDIVGQHHLLDKNMPLRNLIESKNIVNMIFYGPPGTGKTSVSKIAAKSSGMDFKMLNCTSITSADIKNIIDNSQNILFPGGTLLYLDEIQYLNKKQQQVLLEAMENGSIKIIASTTENPYFSVYNAILSRCIIFEFKMVSYKDINNAVKRAILLLENELSETIDCPDDVITKLSKLGGGDVRKSINVLDACILSSKTQNGIRKITTELVSNISQNPIISHDKSGDSHYDLLSAFQKSMRGSDPNASVYYLARLLDAGEILSVCRRLMVCACEDVGLAYPQIIPIVKSCVDIAMQVGMPEARIPLADAVILVSISPKSNSAYIAINKAQEELRKGNIFSVPRHLQNVHCDETVANTDEKNRKTYIYPHDFPNHWIKQEYLPYELKDRLYYKPSYNKNENSFSEYWRKIKDE